MNIDPRARRGQGDSNPTIGAWVTFLVDRFIERGECDFVNDLTSPASALVTLELLDFPTDEWERYSGSFHQSIGYPEGSVERQEGYRLVQWVNQQCVDMVAARAAQPTDDATSRLLAHEVDGGPISTERVEMLLFHFMGGGTETTGSLTASVLKYLAEHPDDRQRLIDEPELLDSATEEFLRVFPPAKAHGRVVVQDTELGGCELRTGEKVLLSWLSVNRDEEVFGADAGEVVLDRFPNRHSSFSYGPHRCPGSHLARTTFQTMLREVLARMPDYRIVDDGVTRFPKQDMLGGYQTMPATFTPGQARRLRPRGSSDLPGPFSTPVPTTSSRKEVTVSSTEIRPAFEGLRVIELCQGMAGPMAGQLLADNGAEVVKIEPPAGDWARSMPGFVMWNRGKDGVALDLADDDARHARAAADRHGRRAHRQRPRRRTTTRSG